MFEKDEINEKEPQDGPFKKVDIDYLKIVADFLPELRELS